MVKINYSWNVEMRNPGRHADNDREFEEESVRERGRGDLGAFQGRHNYLRSIDY